MSGSSSSRVSSRQNACSFDGVPGASSRRSSRSSTGTRRTCDPPSRRSSDASEARWYAGSRAASRKSSACHALSGRSASSSDSESLYHRAAGSRLPYLFYHPLTPLRSGASSSTSRPTRPPDVRGWCLHVQGQPVVVVSIAHVDSPQGLLLRR